METAPSIGIREVFRRFWPDAKPFRGWMLLSLGLVLVSPLLDAAAIWMFKVLIDNVLTPRDFSLFPIIAAAYAALTIVVGAVGFGESYLTVWIGEHFLNRLRIRVFTHLHTLSVDFFDRRRIGDTLSRLTTDITSIESLVLSGITQTAASLIKIVLFAGVLFYLNWHLAVVALVVAPLFLWIARFFANRIRSASREVAGRTGSISTVAEESLGNAPLIQAYGRQDAEVHRFARQSRSSLSAELSAARIGGMFEPLVDLLEVVAIMSIVGVGIYEMSTGAISLGGLLAFLVYLQQMYSPVSNLGQLSNVVYGAAASAERILELFDQRPHVPVPARPHELKRVRGNLDIDRVGFHYPDTADEVLTDVSVSAAPGERVAIVGASGAGKSTLTKLLLRFYDPDRGHIRLDGTDLREVDPKQLREQMAIVLQETLLLDGTIGENILAGRPGATHQSLVSAARAADAHEFIEALPDGYDTRVGQRGRLLSGGQRQRIAIARAMIRDAPILLLDEPTASLDADASQRILAPLNRLMAGRTTIVISHNLLTVTDADKILYLDHGRVTGLGTHSELLERNDGYAHLYHLHHPSTEVVHGASVQHNGGTNAH